MRTFKLFINGEWVSGTETEIKSPFSEKTIGKVHKADEAMVDKAIAAGKKAEKAMAALSAHERKEILRGIVSGLQDRHQEMADIICDEAGKPMQYAKGETSRAIQTFQFAIESVTHMAQKSVDLDAVPTGEGRFGILRRFPIGLVSAVSPFNFPLNLVAHKIAPAIATGCPVVLKPASQTPMAALLLAEICDKAGLPKGGLNVVPCHRDAADAFTVDPRFQLLSFTGSPGVGWKMKDRVEKKKIVLELGGNAAVIVHSDADLEKVVPRVAVGAFAYAGQVCISVQRIIVHKAVYKKFCDMLVKEVENLGVGDPTKEDVVCGPLIDSKNAERIVDWIEEAKEKGARVLIGGQREGNVVSPALLENVSKDTKLGCEEAFGPVATLSSYDDIDDAIAQNNNSDFGLQAGVYTDSMENLWKCYEQLEVGGVIHNDVPTFRVDNMPYGGIKDSGFGREGLPYAFEDYTEQRLLAIRSKY